MPDPACSGTYENGSWILTLETFDNSVDGAFQFGFELLYPQYETVIDADAIDCVLETDSGSFVFGKFERTFEINDFISNTAVTAALGSTINGAESSLTITYEMGTSLPTVSYYTVEIPKYNLNYDTTQAGSPSAVSSFPDPTAITGTWSASTGDSGTLASSAFTVTTGTGFANDIVCIELGNANSQVAGTTLTITM